MVPLDDVAGVGQRTGEPDAMESLDMKNQFIRVDHEGQLTIITLSRPEVMNALHGPAHHELQRAFDEFAADDGQFLCIITGEGERAFCAGSDLKAVSEGDKSNYPPSGYAGLAERTDLHKPLIAAVNGVCLGGGFEIALACDLIVASENASFGLPEPRIGGIALGGGIHRLVRQIGLKQAMGYLMTGRHMSAEEGARLGLVNELVAKGDALAAAKRWGREILQSSPLAVRATKEIAMTGLGELDVFTAMARQDNYPGYKLWRNADDTVEGPRAFAEKRRPIWKGH